MKLLKSAHAGLVFPRRIRRLGGIMAELLPQGARVLDVGCGDGSLDILLLQQRPDLHLEGIDVFRRPAGKIPVTVYDGVHIPFGDASFDAVTFVDVLHHTDDPVVLLCEAARVSRGDVIIKDHLRDRPLVAPGDATC